MTVTPPLSPASSPSSYIPTKSDLSILTALGELQFATAEHIGRFRGLRKTSHSWLRQQLVILCGESTKKTAPAYLCRHYLPRDTPLGTLPYVYSLTSHGRKELVRRGYELFALSRRTRVVSRLPREIDHHFAVNEFFLSALSLALMEPRVQPYHFLHDWKLKYEEQKFTIAVWKQDLRVSGFFSPDGWFEFRLDLGTRLAPRRLLLEMDLGTHTSRDRFKLKLARYLAFFASGKYKKEFGNVKNVTVVFVTPFGEHRRDELRKWTKEQFEQPLYLPGSGLGALDEKDANFFRFLSVPPGSLDPVATFLSPTALPVFDATPRPLIYLPPRGA